MNVFGETISSQQRKSFINEMNKKWQRKHQREQAWLDQMESDEF